MKAIFANPKRIEEVKNIHLGIRETFEDLTLEQILVVGFNWPQDKIRYVTHELHLYKEILSFMMSWDYMQSEGQLSKFKLYNQPAITRHARYRAVFLQDMKRKGYDLTKKLSIPVLEELSCLSIGYATVTYAIKCYLIANYNGEELKEYKGIQPQTGPIHNANEHLFGEKFSNYQHTVMCNQLAVENGFSPSFINTAFYTLG